MIDHFEIKTIKFDQCVDFYSKVLHPLSIELKWSDDLAAGFGVVDNPKVRFVIEKSDNKESAHIAFSAPNQLSVNQFHAIGIENGFVCNGEPGVRKQYASNYYAAFLYDPDGNNIEAVVYV